MRLHLRYSKLKKHLAHGMRQVSNQLQVRDGWRHPGGKLRELGADKLTDAELLAVVISTGVKGKPALEIAEEVLAHFGSLEGLLNRPLEELLVFKGLSDVKIIRIAAAFELAQRTRPRSRRSALDQIE